MIDLSFALTQGDFTLQIDVQSEARVIALFGPSGAGKTTTLDAIAGLRTPSRGRIVVAGRELFVADRGINVPAHARRVGYVPQDVALFPHMNVRRNLLYGRHDGSSPALDEVTNMLEIEALIERQVSGLSGGERQRVALGRALMAGPALLLLDEPLAAVDVALRRRILPFLQRIRDTLSLPIVYVTHDPAEIDMIADAVITLEHGHVVFAGDRPRAGLS